MKKSQLKIAGLLLVTFSLLLLIILAAVLLPEKLRQPNRFDAFLAILRLLFSAVWFIYFARKLLLHLKPATKTND